MQLNDVEYRQETTDVGFGDLTFKSRDGVEVTATGTLTLIRHKRTVFYHRDYRDFAPKEDIIEFGFKPDLVDHKRYTVKVPKPKREVTVVLPQSDLINPVSIAHGLGFELNTYSYQILLDYVKNTTTLIFTEK